MSMSSSEKPNSIQHGGTHYRTGYQHWDWIVDIGYGWQYYCGAATKYLIRHKKKNGMEDLKKAKHFAQKLQSLVAEGRVMLPKKFSKRAERKLFDDNIEKWFHENDAGFLEQNAMYHLARPTTTADIETAIDFIDKIIEREQVVDEMKYGGLKLTARDFTGEGFMAGKDMYQCHRCREHIECPQDADPSKYHQCGETSPPDDEDENDSKPTPAYVDQG